ncbi:unnamed protein product [Rhodiola kirilowii]
MVISLLVCSAEKSIEFSLAIDGIHTVSAVGFSE